MARTKKKESYRIGVKRSRPPRKRNKRSAEAARRTEVWGAEIDRLKAQTFTTLDEGIAAISDSVLGKIGATPAEAPALREFLRVVFLNDPELLAQLGRALAIHAAPGTGIHRLSGRNHAKID